MIYYSMIAGVRDNNSDRNFNHGVKRLTESVARIYLRDTNHMQSSTFKFRLVSTNIAKRLCMGSLALKVCCL